MIEIWIHLMFIVCRSSKFINQIYHKISSFLCVEYKLWKCIVILSYSNEVGKMQQKLLLIQHSSILVTSKNPTQFYNFQNIFLLLRVTSFKKKILLKIHFLHIQKSNQNIYFSQHIIKHRFIIFTLNWIYYLYKGFFY